MGTNADSAVHIQAPLPSTSIGNPPNQSNRYHIYENIPLAGGFDLQGPSSLPSDIVKMDSPPTSYQAFPFAIVDKDSPPSSFQPLDLHVQQNLGNQHKGLSPHADEYLPPSSVGVPQQVRPISKPRVQAKYVGGESGQLQTNPGGPRGQFGGSGYNYIPSAAVSTQVSYPQQKEQVKWRPEATRAVVPGNQQPQQWVEPQASHCNSPYNTYAILVVKNDLEEDIDYLERNIDQEMEEAAAEVTAGTTEEGTREDAPFDPNLVCPMCMKQYRIGEIQLFKAHVKECLKEKEEKEKIPLPQTLTGWVS